jgi:hypothetical protein
MLVTPGYHSYPTLLSVCLSVYQYTQNPIHACMLLIASSQFTVLEATIQNFA